MTSFRNTCWVLRVLDDTNVSDVSITLRPLLSVKLRKVTKVWLIQPHFDPTTISHQDRTDQNRVLRWVTLANSVTVAIPGALNRCLVRDVRIRVLASWTNEWRLFDGYSHGHPRHFVSHFVKVVWRCSVLHFLRV